MEEGDIVTGADGRRGLIMGKNLVQWLNAEGKPEGSPEQYGKEEEGAFHISMPGKLWGTAMKSKLAAYGRVVEKLGSYEVYDLKDRLIDRVKVAGQGGLDFRGEGDIAVSVGLDDLEMHPEYKNIMAAEMTREDKIMKLKELALGIARQKVSEGQMDVKTVNFGEPVDNMDWSGVL